MCSHFPILSFPVYERRYESNVAIENNKVTKNQKLDQSGWKKVESKEGTVTILAISSIIGLGLISMGFAGLFASSFHLHPGICIASIVSGTALTIPSIIALKLGFKKSDNLSQQPSAVENSSSKPDAIHQIANERIAKKKIAEEKRKEKEKKLSKEKANFAKQVPQGYYNRFILSNGDVFYYGNNFTEKGWFGTSISCTIYEYSLSKEPSENTMQSQFGSLKKMSA